MKQQGSKIWRWSQSCNMYHADRRRVWNNWGCQKKARICDQIRIQEPYTEMLFRADKKLETAGN